MFKKTFREFLKKKIFFLTDLVFELSKILNFF